MTHRCRDCDNRPMFSVRKGTCMEDSKLGYQAWAIAIYLVATGLKGVSSMMLHRDLEITQKSAWHPAHRIRKAFEADGGMVFAGTVEANEKYMGGLERNKHPNKQLKAGRGAVGKTAVAGIKNRATGKVAAKVVPNTKGKTLKAFVEDHTHEDAQVHADEARAYKGIDREHEAVSHSVGVWRNNLDGRSHCLA